MSYSSFIAGAALAAIMLPAAANAEHAAGDAGVVYARVVHVEPIVSYVTVRQPARECWDEVVYHDRNGTRGHRNSHYYGRGDNHGRSHYDSGRHGSAGATIAGGIIGGVIGHQFGSGRGKDAATIAGVLIGSSIAHESQSNNRQHYSGHDSRHVETVRRCESHSTSYREERIDGYYVTYEYRGREYTTRTTRRPGSEIAVQLDVTPVSG